MWKLGVVEKLLVAIGRDQEVRAAVLRVPERGRNFHHLSRPVQKLYPLEMPKEKESLMSVQQKTLLITVVLTKTKKLSYSKIKDHLSPTMKMSQTCCGISGKRPHVGPVTQ